MFILQEIEIIPTRGKFAAYAVGQPASHLQDYRGMNLRYKKLSPNLQNVEDCKKWVKDNLKELKYIMFWKGSIWVKCTGTHYESNIKAERVDYMDINELHI